MTTNHPIILKTEHLQVEISAPGAAYAGTRFDWTGFVTQVILDQQHTFCVPEDYTPGKGTGGIGLCNEFGIDMPVGYEDILPGDAFPKFGVGLLTRLDEPTYSFWYPHVIASQFPVEIEASPTRVTFTVQPLECNGFAARLVKTLSVQDNRLTVDYTFTNTGSKAIHTNEYNHNFCAIDRTTVGPDYQITFAKCQGFEQENELTQALDLEGNRLSLRHVPEQAFYCRIAGAEKSDQPQWSILHVPTGIRMSETDNFEPTRIACWGTSHVFSVEVFKSIDLLPGEIARWSRTYTFDTP